LCNGNLIIDKDNFNKYYNFKFDNLLDNEYKYITLKGDDARCQD